MVLMEIILQILGKEGDQKKTNLLCDSVIY